MEGVHQEIYEFLKETEKSFTINMIAQVVQVERHTAAKALDTLKALGLVEYQEKGKSKVYKATSSPLFATLSNHSPLTEELKSVLENISETITIQDKDNNILWSNKKDQEGKACYEIFAGRTSTCENCQLTEHDNTINCNNHSLQSKTVKQHGDVIGRINIRR